MNTKTIAGFIVAIAVLAGAMWFMNRQPAVLPPPPPPPPPAEVLAKAWPTIVKNAAGPARGNPNAPWTIVECGDFQCPNCGKARPDVERLIADSGGKVKLYFFNYPLTMIHKHAEVAAEAGLAASAQGKFWPMYDMLYGDQDSLIPSEIEYHAQSIPGLNAKQFKSDLDSHKYAQQVSADLALMQQIHVEETPTFLVRKSEGGTDTKVSAFVGAHHVKDSPGPALDDLVKNPPWVAAPVTTAKAPSAPVGPAGPAPGP